MQSDKEFDSILIQYSSEDDTTHTTTGVDGVENCHNDEPGGEVVNFNNKNHLRNSTGD